MHPSMPWKPNGKSSFPSIMPDGGLHQRTNLVHHLWPAPFQPSPLHSTHSIRRQQISVWWPATYRSCSLWRPPGRWLLWKTHHSWNRTRPRISWLYVWNKAAWVDLSGSHQCLSSPFTILGFPFKSPSQRLSIQMPHCHQRSLSWSQSQTRTRPVNSVVHTGWLSQRGASITLRAIGDSASELPPVQQKNCRHCPDCFSDSPQFDSSLFLGGCLVTCLFFLFLLSLVSFPQFLAQLSPFRLLWLIPAPMDHVQGRAFHHHLARAIMHLNHLAGLLPFFEPSIEYDEMMPPSNTRGEHPAQRGLHTFVPLPSASTSPSMASHAGIPSRLIVNPEPNLRPISVFSAPRPDSAPLPRSTTIPRNSSPLPELVAEPNPDPFPLTDHPRARTTIPVPARSKQRTRAVEDPQPKKIQKRESEPVPRAPLSSRAGNPGRLPVEEDSDESDAGESYRAASTHDRPSHNNSPDEARATPISTPGIHADTSTVTLTPNPEAPPPLTLHLRQPDPQDPPRESSFKEWTDADDHELASMKQDTRSRPSWKSIGARLHRDPQVCKLRWSLLKQMDQHGRVNAPQEPDAED